MSNPPPLGLPRRSLAGSSTPYDRTFWLAYVSNGLTTLANAMLVRYADFVAELGGEEQQLGLIVGCGMIGSILMRIVQGEAIDRFGAGRIWRWSICIYVVSLLLNLTVSTAFSPAIFLVRIVMQSSLAGMFGSSITFVSLRVPAPRMAEIIGALGTSGFIGICVGPLLSDWVASSTSDSAVNVARMFWAADAFAIVAAATAWLATRREARPTPRRRPHLAYVVRRYLPGVVSLAAAAMGAGLSIPFAFLRPFAVEMSLGNIGFYFAIYASTAFIARLATRSLFERHGNRPWILAGLVCLAVSYAAYIPVTRTWELAFPAAIAGVAHALLFPSIMAAGASAFPRRFLGVATSLMLAMFDVGTLVGAPVVGKFLHVAKTQGLPAYPAMWGATAGAIALVAIAVWASRVK